jgi:hypothetical protein
MPESPPFQKEIPGRNEERNVMTILNLCPNLLLSKRRFLGGMKKGM